MRVISWNIQHGGGRRINGIFDQLMNWDPDVVVLSELRGTRASRELVSALHGSQLEHVESTVSESKPSENSISVLSRYPLVRHATPTGLVDEHRWVQAEVVAPEPFLLAGLHVPNRTSGRKHDFLDAVVNGLPGEGALPGLAVGDMNTGRNGADEESVFFDAFEDSWFDRLEVAGWTDAYRSRLPDGRDFSWYSTHGNGFRLDHAFATASMNERINEVRYDWGEARCSDHAALIVEIG